MRAIIGSTQNRIRQIFPLFCLSSISASLSSRKSAGFTPRIAVQPKPRRQVAMLIHRNMTPFTSTGCRGKVSSTPRPKAAGSTANAQKPKTTPDSRKRAIGA